MILHHMHEAHVRKWQSSPRKMEGHCVGSIVLCACRVLPTATGNGVGKLLYRPLLMNKTSISIISSL